MSTLSCDIQGGDYVSSGRASKQIKEMLKRIGADPAAIRRAMVAAYEAEMNVVIHADEGRLEAAITPEALEVSVVDRGPGIANVEKVMREGFSTAPAKARELGFGAGMGLPNIRKNTDRFSLHSVPGVGTKLHFMVMLQPYDAADDDGGRLSIASGKCIRCLRCLTACPTQAIRIRSASPVILKHLCVNCAACMLSCPAGVYGMESDDEPFPAPDPEAVLALPAELAGQFGPRASFAMLTEALTGLGWRDIRYTDAWEHALREEVSRYRADEVKPGPIIAPVCPAVLALIQTRYPALLAQVAPFLTLAESARQSLPGKRLYMAALCPAQHAQLREPSPLADAHPISLGRLMDALAPLINKPKAIVAYSPEPTTPGWMEICGMPSVLRFLDEMENDLLEDCPIAALYACDYGCAGAPTLREHPAVARQRHTAMRRAEPHPIPQIAPRRIKPLAGRSGIRLDADMRVAIQKLAAMDRLAKRLPGRDCGVCGAPSCMALAEDVVLGRAVEEDCIYQPSIRTSGAEEEQALLLREKRTDSHPENGSTTTLHNRPSTRSQIPFGNESREVEQEG